MSLEDRIARVIVLLRARGLVLSEAGWREVYKEAEYFFKTAPDETPENCAAMIWRRRALDHCRSGREQPPNARRYVVVATGLAATTVLVWLVIDVWRAFHDARIGLGVPRRASAATSTPGFTGSHLGSRGGRALETTLRPLDGEKSDSGQKLESQPPPAPFDAEGPLSDASAESSTPRLQPYLRTSVLFIRDVPNSDTLNPELSPPGTLEGPRYFGVGVMTSNGAGSHSTTSLRR